MVRHAKRPPLVAGNWKMFGLTPQLEEARTLARLLAAAPHACEVALCPPATLLAPMRDLALGSGIRLGGQTCHANANGAHTGDISAAMLKDAGAQLVIVGHSERRTNHAETNEMVAGQARAALAAGLEPIICIGETLVQNEAGQTRAVLTDQLAHSIPREVSPSRSERLTIAYEPVWAIGAGRTPTMADISQLHAVIKDWLTDRFGEGAAGVRVLYGGSVKPDNAADILKIAGVDGALVGGASLKAHDFYSIIGCYKS
jgi:triosephosphate isomerase (TIM)